MIGQNIGARQHERVNKIIRNMLLMSLVMALVVGALFLTIPDFFYALFTDDTAVIEFGRVFLRIMSVGCIVVGFSGAMKSIVTGAGAALLSLIIGILDGVMRILICLLFFYVFHQEVQSYFWGAAFCQLVPGIVCLVYYLSGKWKTKKLLSES